MLKKMFVPCLVVFLVVFIAAGAFAIVKGLEKNKQSLVKVGESITVPEGAGIESAVSVGGAVTVYGEVYRDVVSVGDSVYLKDSAIVNGDVVSVGGKVMKEPGAIIKGDVIEVMIPNVSPVMTFVTKGGMFKSWAAFELISILSIILLAIIMVSLFTPQLGKVSGILEKNLWKSFLIGVALLILFIPIIVLLVISVLGIVLVPVWVILVFAAGFFGHFAVGQLLGKKVFNAFRVYGRSMMTETLLGVIIIALLGLVPVGGFIVKVIIALCGLGAVYQSKFGSL